MKTILITRDTDPETIEYLNQARDIIAKEQGYTPDLIKSKIVIKQVLKFFIESKK